MHRAFIIAIEAALVAYGVYWLSSCTAHAATFHGEPGVINFSARVIPPELAGVDLAGKSNEEIAELSRGLGLKIEQHGEWAVATYREWGVKNPRTETIEMLALAGDRVEFDATGASLVAMRRHRWAGEAVAFR